MSAEQASPGFWIWGSIGLVVAGNIAYHVGLKQMPRDVHPLAALVVLFATSAATALLAWPLAARGRSLPGELGKLDWTPFAVGVAMLRYRLYEVDRVVSRTLVYGALTVILGAAYAGLVLAGQAIFSSFAGGSDLAIAVSTLVVAALFLPLRSRVQRIVDRRFYRRRYDARRTLEGFATRLREQVELDGLRTELQDVVRDTMEPVDVTLWIRKGAL